MYIYLWIKFFRLDVHLFEDGGNRDDNTPSIPVLRAHFKSLAIPKYPHLLGIIALNMLITPINSSLLPSSTLHAPMHGHK
jgi:hypothetical protein